MKKFFIVVLTVSMLSSITPVFGVEQDPKDVSENIIFENTENSNNNADDGESEISEVNVSTENELEFFNSDFDDTRVSSVLLNIDQGDGQLTLGVDYTFSATLVATPDYRDIVLAIPLFDEVYEDYTEFMTFHPNSDDWFYDAEGNKFRYEISYLNAKPYLTLKIPKMFKDEEDWTKGAEYPILVKLKEGVTPYNFETNLKPLIINDIKDDFEISYNFDENARYVKAINRPRNRKAINNSQNWNEEISIGTEVFPNVQFYTYFGVDYEREPKSIVWAKKQKSKFVIDIPKGLTPSSDENRGVKVKAGYNGYYMNNYNRFSSNYNAETRKLSIDFFDVEWANNDEMQDLQFEITLSDLVVDGEETQFEFKSTSYFSVYDKYDNFLSEGSAQSAAFFKYKPVESNMKISSSTLSRKSRNGIESELYSYYYTTHIGIGGDIITERINIPSNDLMKNLDDFTIYFSSASNEYSWMWYKTLQTGKYLNAGSNLSIYYSTIPGNDVERDDWIKIGDYDPSVNHEINFDQIQQNMDHRIYALKFTFPEVKGKSKIINGQSVVDIENSFSVVERPILEREVDDLLFANKNGKLLPYYEKNLLVERLGTTENRKTALEYTVGGLKQSLEPHISYSNNYRNGDISFRYFRKNSDNNQKETAYPGLEYTHQSTLTVSNNSFENNQVNNPVLTYKFNKKLVDPDSVKIIKIHDNSGPVQLKDGLTLDQINKNIESHIRHDGDYFYVDLEFFDSFGKDGGRADERGNVDVEISFRILDKDKIINGDARYEETLKNYEIKEDILYVQLFGSPNIGTLNDSDRSSYNYETSSEKYSYQYLNVDLLRISSKPIAGYYTEISSSEESEPTRKYEKFKQDEQGLLKHTIINERIEDEEGSQYSEKIKFTNPRFSISSIQQLIVDSQDITLKIVNNDTKDELVLDKNKVKVYLGTYSEGTQLPTDPIEYNQILHQYSITLVYEGDIDLKSNHSLVLTIPFYYDKNVFSQQKISSSLEENYLSGTNIKIDKLNADLSNKKYGDSKGYSGTSVSYLSETPSDNNILWNIETKDEKNRSYRDVIIYGEEAEIIVEALVSKEAKNDFIFPDLSLKVPHTFLIEELIIQVETTSGSSGIIDGVTYDIKNEGSYSNVDVKFNDDLTLSKGQKVKITVVGKTKVYNSDVEKNDYVNNMSSQEEAEIDLEFQTDQNFSHTFLYNKANTVNKKGVKQFIQTENKDRIDHVVVKLNSKISFLTNDANIGMSGIVKSPTYAFPSSSMYVSIDKTISIPGNSYLWNSTDTVSYIVAEIPEGFIFDPEAYFPGDNKPFLSNKKYQVISDGGELT